MYKYIQGSAVASGSPGIWNPVRLNELTFAQIFTDYTGALAEIEVVELKKRYSLDLWDLATTLRFLPVTFGDWLTSIGNQSIPLQDVTPDKSRVYATYRDLWNSGFQVQSYNRNIAVEQELTLDQMIDAIVTKDGVEYSVIDKHVLFVVNGLVHNSVSLPEGLVVQDAGLSLQTSKENRIGLINFEAIGGINRYPITAEMLAPPTDDLPYKEATYIKLTGIDTADKTVGIVIGGYLHLLDSAYTQVGSNLLKVNFADYPLVERYWILKQNASVGNIKLTPFANRTDKLDFRELTSNDNIAALLTLSQSFIVTIDAVGMGIARVMAHQAELAGRYIAYDKPMLPLISDSGRLVNYTSYAAKHDYVVRTTDYFLNNYVRNTYEYEAANYTTNHRYTLRPTQYQDLFWWQIFKAKQ